MSNETIKTQANDLMERGKELVAEGNQRQIVFTGKSGAQLFQVKATVAAGIAVVLLITGLVSLPFAVIAGAIAYAMGVRADVQQTTL